MTVSDTFLIHLAQAIGLGLGASFLLWLFRGYAPVRRVRLSALLSVAMGGLYLVVSGSGIYREETIARVVAAIGVMLAANTVLHFAVGLPSGAEAACCRAAIAGRSVQRHRHVRGGVGCAQHRLRRAARRVPCHLHRCVRRDRPCPARYAGQRGGRARPADRAALLGGRLGDGERSRRASDADELAHPYRAHPQ